jgi:hypothetical protein
MTNSLPQGQDVTALTEAAQIARYVAQPIDTAPRDGTVIAVVQSIRWLAYKPSSEQYRKGIKGRWQEFDGYGWENARETPEQWLRPDPLSPVAGAPVTRGLKEAGVSIDGPYHSKGEKHPHLRIYTDRLVAAVYCVDGDMERTEREASAMASALVASPPPSDPVTKGQSESSDGERGT